jgi:lipoyl-dependent peroxiredoxin
MITKTAEAWWKGDIEKGKGTMELGSGKFDGRYTYGSRFEDASGTNPEELIAAAQAGCFNMAFASMLENDGYHVSALHTTARVSLDKQGEEMKITGVEIDTEVDTTPLINEVKVREEAEVARHRCPVANALAGVEIKVFARTLKISKVA